MLYKRASNNIEVCLDAVGRCLRVAVTTPIAPALKGFRKEVGVYYSPREWEASPYYSRVTEAVLEEIDYFWIDLFSPPSKPPTL